MKITDNFHFLIEKVELGDLNDLYTATFHEKKQGSFECFKNHVTGSYYVKCTYLYDTLLLRDQEAKVVFLEWVEKRLPSTNTTKTLSRPII